MKKTFYSLLLILISVSSFGQLTKAVVRGDSSSFLGTKTDIAKQQTADYIITKIGSTIYATARKGFTSYSGSSFNTVLTNAMSQLTSGGKIIVQGTYTGLDVGILVPYSNISIIGYGKNLTKFQIKASADVGKSVTGLFLVKNVNNFRIENIELDGNAANQTKIDNGGSTTAVLSAVYAGDGGTTADNTQVVNCYIHDWTMYGVYDEVNTTATFVKDCIFVNCYWNSVTLAGKNGFAINCQSSGSGDVGISFYNSGHTALNCVVLTANGTHGSINSHWGFGVESTASLVSKNHRFISCSADSCDSGLSMFEGQDVVVYNLKVRNATIYGVDTRGASGVIIENSDIRCLSTGFTQAIVLESSFNSVHSVGVIVRNNFMKGSYAINVNGANQSGNVVVNNVMTGSFQDTGTGTLRTSNYGTSSAKWFAGTSSATSAAAAATTGTISVTVNDVVTITPTGDCTFNFSTTGAVAGQRVSFVITTSGTTSYTMTFGTNFKSTGTLATGTVTAKKFVVSFIYDGSTLNEVSRTTAM